MLEVVHVCAVGHVCVGRSVCGYVWVRQYRTHVSGGCLCVHVQTYEGTEECVRLSVYVVCVRRSGEERVHVCVCDSRRECGSKRKETESICERDGSHTGRRLIGTAINNDEKWYRNGKDRSQRGADRGRDGRHRNIRKQ